MRYTPEWFESGCSASLCLSTCSSSVEKSAHQQHGTVCFVCFFLLKCFSPGNNSQLLTRIPEVFGASSTKKRNTTCRLLARGAGGAVLPHPGAGRQLRLRHGADALGLGAASQPGAGRGSGAGDAAAAAPRPAKRESPGGGMAKRLTLPPANMGCAQSPTERGLSSWKGPFCTSTLVGGRVSHTSLTGPLVLFWCFGSPFKLNQWPLDI